MATIQKAARYELKVHINFWQGGFSEIYLLPLDVLATVKAIAARLISARADILSKNYTIAHASLSRSDVLRDRFRPNTYRHGPINLATEATIDDVGTCNDSEIGPLWRWDSGTGKSVNRVIRGLRDDHITDQAASYQSSAAFAKATADTYAGAIANTTTHNDALKMYLSMVMHYTRHYSKFGATVAGSYDETDWASFQYRRVGSHDVGARWGAVRGRDVAWS